ncbi:MarR family winged helix-turn-helix transcriptional regulator [Mucilaginibacter sp. L3T2-6]|uniref:MarR family winged helix-turn-helix transcriptional regulator n=1 Tax=Mucilaginibacter sp. L3T2-6 TaxID=3062491 RepID=UPI0026754A84|nr:MarR family transcriptional regulator [Mucilaginibacter sp. L3T2-6]MDO3644018.1 MarR family transcriptional regulator [Mucilaginibacter sp. L3T2-6]MDV6216469.1 MarR family transcriptional regulator [Mucilaginibacter sp. L3T2-6]
MNTEYIERLRLFNRFYTSVMGLLDKQYLDSNFSLTEVRVLYELANNVGEITATALIQLLHLDKGYLSRILRTFEKKKLIIKKQSATDKRAFFLQLSPQGEKIFTGLNAAAQQQAAHLLSSVGDADAASLIGHMDAIRNILTKTVVKNEC